MSRLNAQLSTWISGLLELVEERRKTYERSLEMSRKLEALRQFMAKENVPDDVREAIALCLDWNPHARPK